MTSRENSSRNQDSQKYSLNTEELFHNYFNLGLIGMAVTSPEKCWIEVNEKLCQIFGYSREELTELTWAEITHPDDLKADEIEFKRVLSGESEGYSMDKRFFRKDGSVIYASISACCIRRDDGSVNHFVALVQDITDRKIAELELHKINSELEKIVAERTKDLEDANIQLKHSCYTDFLTELPNYRTDDFIRGDLMKIFQPLNEIALTSLT